MTTDPYCHVFAKLFFKKYTKCWLRPVNRTSVVDVTKIMSRSNANTQFSFLYNRLSLSENGIAKREQDQYGKYGLKHVCKNKEAGDSAAFDEVIKNIKLRNRSNTCALALSRDFSYRNPMLISPSGF